MLSRSSAAWINQEFFDIDLGDRRLDKRFMMVSAGLADRSECNISRSFDSWSDIKACYRFFSNARVTHDKILAPHRDRTIERIAGCRRVLLIQDTMVLSYPGRPGSVNLGLCSKHYSSSTPALGLISHEILAVSDQGIPLGIIGQKFIERKTFRENGRLTKHQYQRLPIDMKESNKWIEMIQGCKDLNFGNTQTIHVADREGDIYELYRDCIEWGENFVVRASHNRAINKESRRHAPGDKLFDVLKASRAQGRIAIEINDTRPGRKTRRAKLSIVSSSFEMPPPPNRTKNNCYNNLPNLAMTAIMAIERNPPKNIEPIQWTLLTNLPIESVADAVDKVRLYSRRWNIEILHKILKSGFAVEKAQLRDGENLKKYIVLKFILAWRIFWLTRNLAFDRNASCETVLTEHEWKILHRLHNKTMPLPEDPPSVEQVYFWIAKLGGFIGRSLDGDPGVISIWRGWNRLMQALDDYDAFCG